MQDEVIWLAPKPSVVKFSRLWLSGVGVFGLGISIFFGMKFWFLGVGLLVAVFGNLGLAWTLVVELLATRIGSDGSRLYIKDGAGRSLSAEPERVFSNGKGFVILDMVAVLRNGLVFFYEKEPFDQHIQPLLDKATPAGFKVELETAKNALRILWRHRLRSLLFLLCLLGGTAFATLMVLVSIANPPA